MLPTLFIKKNTIKPPAKKHKFVGYSLYTIVLFLQGIFSGGVGSLAVYVLTLLFGTSKLQTMGTRRAIVAVMSPIAVAALLITGFISIWFGLIGLVTQFIGTHICTNIVLRRGELFATVAMAVVILVSSVALLVSAI